MWSDKSEKSTHSHTIFCSILEICHHKHQGGSLKVVGIGFGRTGTSSLKEALETLDYDHGKEKNVLRKMATVEI